MVIEVKPYQNIDAIETYQNPPSLNLACPQAKFKPKAKGRSLN